MQAPAASPLDSAAAAYRYGMDDFGTTHQEGLQQPGWGDDVIVYSSDDDSREEEEEDVAISRSKFLRNYVDELQVFGNGK